MIVFLSYEVLISDRCFYIILFDIVVPCRPMLQIERLFILVSCWTLDLLDRDRSSLTIVNDVTIDELVIFFLCSLLSRRFSFRSIKH